jgi:hypothetical protein
MNYRPEGLFLFRTGVQLSNRRELPATRYWFVAYYSVYSRAALSFRPHVDSRQRRIRAGRGPGTLDLGDDAAGLRGASRRLESTQRRRLESTLRGHSFRDGRRRSGGRSCRSTARHLRPRFQTPSPRWEPNYPLQSPELRLVADLPRGGRGKVECFGLFADWASRLRRMRTAQC